MTHREIIIAALEELKGDFHLMSDLDLAEILNIFCARRFHQLFPQKDWIIRGAMILVDGAISNAQADDAVLMLTDYDAWKEGGWRNLKTKFGIAEMNITRGTNDQLQKIDYAAEIAAYNAKTSPEDKRRDEQSDIYFYFTKDWQDGEIPTGFPMCQQLKRHVDGLEQVGALQFVADYMLWRQECGCDNPVSNGPLAIIDMMEGYD